MKIEFWLDYLCPITYLTHKNLMEVLKELKIKNYELIYRSFEMIEYCEEDYKIMDVWMLHHNQSEEEIQTFLKYQYPEFEKLKYFDVNKAHQLSHLAKRFNIAKEINTDLLNAFFEDDKDIANIDVLVEIGNKHGMCEALIRSTLSSNTFRNQILLNRENAFLRGIDRIPHIRINVKNHYNGYLSKVKLKEILITHCKETKVETYCVGEKCNIEKAF